MTQHLGKPIASPALMEHIGTRFRKAVESYASSNGIPWVRFGKGDRKIDVMQPYLQAQAATGRSGVAAVGVSQEFQRVWSGMAPHRQCTVVLRLSRPGRSRRSPAECPGDAPDPPRPS